VLHLYILALNQVLCWYNQYYVTTAWERLQGIRVIGDLVKLRPCDLWQASQLHMTQITTRFQMPKWNINKHKAMEIVNSTNNFFFMTKDAIARNMRMVTKYLICSPNGGSSLHTQTVSYPSSVTFDWYRTAKNLYRATNYPTNTRTTQSLTVAIITNRPNSQSRSILCNHHYTNSPKSDLTESKQAIVPRISHLQQRPCRHPPYCSPAP